MLAAFGAFFRPGSRPFSRWRRAFPWQVFRNATVFKHQLAFAFEHHNPFEHHTFKWSILAPGLLSRATGRVQKKILKFPSLFFGPAGFLVSQSGYVSAIFFLCQALDIFLEQTRDQLDDQRNHQNISLVRLTSHLDFFLTTFKNTYILQEFSTS